MQCVLTEARDFRDFGDRAALSSWTDIFVNLLFFIININISKLLSAINNTYLYKPIYIVQYNNNKIYN